ncbi:unnamed protein product [Symbiodinium pilosum]|uniref:Photosystem I reaction center subunit VIII n=1 Tax=Symbiodinium pilosum TaxID=2952 RepID=A0A812WZT0_SYMPI|nr:unnamed protein product [Symbiodinium pilosum]
MASRLLPSALVVAAFMLLGSLVARSFVSPPASSRTTAKALHALPQPGQKTDAKKEEGGFKMPKPDMRLMNEQSKTGLSYDQDQRVNMWGLEPEVKFQESDSEMLPATIYFPVIIALTIGSIFFFAKLFNDDPRFGGALGDDARLINEWG